MNPIDSVLAEVDRLHGQDPAGKELDYAERMTRWLHQLDPNPDPLLQIAIRAQHLKRWECPRGDYPADRRGYLQWRHHAARHHANLVAELMRAASCAEPDITRVMTLVEKRGLGRDPDVQTLEDCACLAFLEKELEAFAAKHPKSKVHEILHKTWRKMSPTARELATAFVPAPES